MRSRIKDANVPRFRVPACRSKGAQTAAPATSVEKITVAKCRRPPRSGHCADRPRLGKQTLCQLSYSRWGGDGSGLVRWADYHRRAPLGRGGG